MTKSSKLRELIREIIIEQLNEIEDGPGGMDQAHEPVIDPNSKLRITPGSPFQTGAGVTNLGMIPNEARALLSQWTDAARNAWNKFGHPNSWPMDVRQSVEKLGNDFQARMGLRQPGTDNQTRADNPATGMDSGMYY